MARLERVGDSHQSSPVPCVLLYERGFTGRIRIKGELADREAKSKKLSRRPENHVAETCFVFQEIRKYYISKTVIPQVNISIK